MQLFMLCASWLSYVMMIFMWFLAIPKIAEDLSSMFPYSAMHWHVEKHQLSGYKNFVPGASFTNVV